MKHVLITVYDCRAIMLLWNILWITTVLVTYSKSMFLHILQIYMSLKIHILRQKLFSWFNISQCPMDVIHQHHTSTKSHTHWCTICFLVPITADKWTSYTNKILNFSHVKFQASKMKFQTPCKSILASVIITCAQQACWNTATNFCMSF
jgi:hypothetical protein